MINLEEYSKRMMRDHPLEGLTLHQTRLVCGINQMEMLIRGTSEDQEGRMPPEDALEVAAYMWDADKAALAEFAAGGTLDGGPPQCPACGLDSTGRWSGECVLEDSVCPKCGRTWYRGTCVQEGQDLTMKLMYDLYDMLVGKVECDLVGDEYPDDPDLIPVWRLLRRAVTWLCERGALNTKKKGRVEV